MLMTSSPTGPLIVSEDPLKEDSQWLEAVARGDRQIYERLFRRYYARVYAFALRKVGDPQLAEEISSDTLLTVWTDAARFRGQSAVSTWILGIAYRKSLRAHRSRRRAFRLHEPQADVETVADPEDESPERHVSDDVTFDRLGDAIAQLTEEHRNVLRLTALGHSCAQIADIVGCPRNTVKTRAFHARIRLRELLDSDETDRQRQVLEHD